MATRATQANGFGRLLIVLLLLGGGRPVSPAYAHGPFHERLSLITQQIRQQPSNAELYLQRAELHRAHGDAAAALGDYYRAEQLNGDLQVVHLGRARLYLDQNDFESALAEVNRFLTSEPEDPQGLFLRASILVRQGRTREALSDMDRSLAMMRTPRPEHYITRARLIESAFADDASLQRALAGLEAGLQRLGMVAVMELEAVELERRLGRFGSALARLDALSTQYARKELVYFRRAEVLASAGRQMEAEACYTEALEIILDLPVHLRNTIATQHLEAQVRSKLMVDEEAQ